MALKGLTISILCCFLVFQATDGYLFGLFDDYSPTAVIDNFRLLISTSKEQIKSQIAAHRNVNFVLKEIKDFIEKERANFGETKMSEFYQKMEKIGKTLVQKLKSFDTFHNLLEETSLASTTAADEVLLRLKELMKVFSADEKSLPPSAFEIRSSVNYGHQRLEAFRNFGNSQYKTIDGSNVDKVVGDFQVTLDSLAASIDETIAANKETIKVLRELGDFAKSQEDMLEEIGRSLTSLLLELQTLFGKVNKAKIGLVNHLQLLNPLEERIRRTTSKMLISYDQTLKGKFSKMNLSPVKMSFIQQNYDGC